MFHTLRDSSKVIIFTAIVLLLALLCSLIPGMNSFVYMLTPTITVFIMMLIVTRDGYRKSGWKMLGLHKLGIRSWLFVLIIPVIPIALSLLVVWLTGLSSFVSHEDFMGYSWSMLPLVIVISYIQAVFTQSMGEELGWRGYLLPLMVNCMGKRKAMLLNGFIHGVWHFPVIINTGIYHADEKLWLILPFAVLSTVFLAPVIGEVRLHTGSVWTSSMMHTTHNLAWTILGYLIVNNHEAANYIFGDMSIVVILFYAALTFYLWRKKSTLSAS